MKIKGRQSTNVIDVRNLDKETFSKLNAETASKRAKAERAVASNNKSLLNKKLRSPTPIKDVPNALSKASQASIREPSKRDPKPTGFSNDKQIPVDSKFRTPTGKKTSRNVKKVK